MITSSAAITEALYTSRQAALALGMAERHVDSAVRQLGFEPTLGGRGSGRPRRWSLADIMALKIGRCWMHRGVSWLVARKAVRWIRAAGLENLQECPVLVLRGEEISTLSSSEELVGSVLEGSPGSGMAVTCDLRSCLQQIEERLARSPAADAATASCEKVFPQILNERCCGVACDSRPIGAD